MIHEGRQLLNSQKLAAFDPFEAESVGSSPRPPNGYTKAANVAEDRQVENRAGKRQLVPAQTVAMRVEERGRRLRQRAESNAR